MLRVALTNVKDVYGTKRMKKNSEVHDFGD